MEEKKFKLITAIDRINYFSDNFIDYYKKWFLVEEFYFMVHEKNYESIKLYLFSKGFGENNIEKYTIKTFGEGHNIINQNRIKTDFLNDGYIVVYADMDERIYHPNLREYIQKSELDFIIPQGMQIVHEKGEAPLDFTRNIIEQRNTCVLDTFWYSKVCILKKDFKWNHGRHNKPNVHTIDVNVYMIDVGKACKDFMIQNNIVSSEIYLKVMWRYKETNVMNIEREIYNKIIDKSITVPSDLKHANPF
jgi:hypothetical protein